MHKDCLSFIVLLTMVSASCNNYSIANKIHQNHFFFIESTTDELTFSANLDNDYP